MWSDRFVVRDLSGIRPGFSISVVRRPVAQMASVQSVPGIVQEMSMHSPHVHPLNRGSTQGNGTAKGETKEKWKFLRGAGGRPWNETGRRIGKCAK